MMIGITVTIYTTRIPTCRKLRRNSLRARDDIDMTQHIRNISKKKALLISTALLLAVPAAAQAEPINGQKCSTPGALIRANNSRFICASEGAKSRWRRVNGELTITSILEAMPRYSLLVTALKKAGLDTTLRGSGPFTLFAPRNAAFLALPKAKLDFLLDPANVAVLREVLLHHVVTGEVMAKDLNTASYSALDGTLLDVVVRTSGITIDGARVTMADVDATNGVVHAVSSVLVPDDVVIGS
ncbi:MAG: fasciclin domain-containing protein [Actinobacteria bacterium]|nr:fasciclin domain-containing protein [Acidimicrobiia bacterium]NCZ56274.1 fasciclin domain-containing protein [Acidimicrobiia bacterium]NDD60651.1 fasciclin domain-containing protein [Actinomycetota bacterium]